MRLLEQMEKRMTQQKKTKDEIIRDMCMTYRHDFGLLTDIEKTVYTAQMRQILENAILPNLQDLEYDINKEVWRPVETPIEVKYKEMNAFYQDRINHLDDMLVKSMEMNKNLIDLLVKKSKSLESLGTEPEQDSQEPEWVDISQEDENEIWRSIFMSNPKVSFLDVYKNLIDLLVKLKEKNT
jgi:Ran GTPase-activating protein (RanGAP) involved in mRNA processing and transport